MKHMSNGFTVGDIVAVKNKHNCRYVYLRVEGIRISFGCDMEISYVVSVQEGSYRDVARRRIKIPVGECWKVGAEYLEQYKMCNTKFKHLVVALDSTENVGFKIKCAV